MEDFALTFDLDMDFDGFDISGIDVGGTKTQNRYTLPKIHSGVKNHAVKYNNAVDFVKQFSKNILNGDAIHCLTSGNFIFGDIFEAFAVEENLLIEDMTASTLSISKDNVDSLHNLLAGDFLRSLNLIVSDYFWSHNRQNAPYIYSQLDIDDMFQLAVAGTHTKVTLLKIDGRKIVFTGSANFRSSRCVEFFQVETNPETYDFHKAWHDEILGKYATVKKSVRASKLYDMITQNTEGKKSWDQE